MKKEYNRVHELLKETLNQTVEKQKETKQKIHEVQDYNEKMKRTIDQFTRDSELKQDKYIQNLNELRRRYFNDLHYNGLLDVEFKDLNKKLKQMQSQIIRIHRQNDKDTIMAGKNNEKSYQEQKKKQLANEEIEKKKKELKEKLEDIQKLNVNSLEEKIDKKDRAIISMEK